MKITALNVIPPSVPPSSRDDFYNKKMNKVNFGKFQTFDYKKNLQSLNKNNP